MTRVNDETTLFALRIVQNIPRIAIAVVVDIKPTCGNILSFKTFLKKILCFCTISHYKNSYEKSK